MIFFEEAALRLKQQLGVTQDRDVAGALNMTPRAWAGRKKNNSFPDAELYALAAKRPELSLDVNYVLTGASLSPRQSQLQALARQVTKKVASPEDREQSLKMLDQAELEMAGTNARRNKTYEEITEVLRMCSDETVDLVSQLVAKLYRAELVEREQK